MKITIKNIKGETFNLEVDPSESVKNLINFSVSI